MGKIKNNDKVEVQYLKLKKSWKLYKSKPGNSLFKAVLHAYRCKLIFIDQNLLILSQESDRNINDVIIL